jgi:hypothetical protein
MRLGRMVVLGGGRFFMSEVPLYAQDRRCCGPHTRDSGLAVCLSARCVPIDTFTTANTAAMYPLSGEALKFESQEVLGRS